MTTTDARVIANDEIDRARQMSGNPATEARAVLARIILALCDQIDAHQPQLPDAVVAAQKAKSWAKKAKKR